MIRCIAIDDEFLALEVIENYVERLPHVQLVKTFTNALESISFLNQEQPDLIFLDIDMPEINGIEFLKSLNKPPLAIFTTAYSQFAPEAFDLDAVDYLIKPIPFERFLKAIQKVEQRMNSTADKNNQPYLFIKSDYKTFRVDFDDILFIEGMKDFISVRTSNQEIPTLLTISGILEKLPASNFIRVHRSFVIALNKISSIERGHIFIGEFKIPIGDMYRDELMKRIV
ncbi:LytTR family DNA-binding domain-containing protein [Daejeonella sp.]|uniref:LytR/AlgR family response regulator transcription factor n=1 Tax=Daejeonella sp. TaxID=2805397 RepID=UPI002726541E|nr:LytTR family DNA-binding domain-containing protein [Daejeonella sp.]MDO8994367.1 LytTR family DNA-binding domain-containing protein [Daejeonella sp.]MDP2413031.1 LytTR family DNA-binding domain-containing protein [Daejeonella sp.]